MSIQVLGVMRQKETMLMLAKVARDRHFGVLHRLRRVGLVALALLVVSVAVEVATAAACVPGRTQTPLNTTFGDGWAIGPLVDGSHCLDGSTANITVKDPTVDAGNGSNPTISAWTALIDPTTSEIGQIGYLNTTPNYTRYNFAEYASGTTIKDLKTFPADPVGSTPAYKVTYSSGDFHMFYDASNYYNFSASSYNGCWAEQGGETHDWNSQMPGVQSGHENFSNVEIRHSTDEHWYTTQDWVNSGWSAQGICPSPFIVDTYPGDPCSGNGNFNLTPGVHMGHHVNVVGVFDNLDIWDMCT